MRGETSSILQMRKWTLGPKYLLLKKGQRQHSNSDPAEFRSSIDQTALPLGREFQEIPWKWGGRQAGARGSTEPVLESRKVHRF